MAISERLRLAQLDPTIPPITGFTLLFGFLPLPTAPALTETAGNESLVLSRMLASSEQLDANNVHPLSASFGQLSSKEANLLSVVPARSKFNQKSYSS